MKSELNPLYEIVDGGKWRLEHVALRQKRVAIGLPAYGGQVSAYYKESVNDLGALLGQLGIPAAFIDVYNESLIGRARDYITSSFLRGDFTDLVWIDADQKIDAWDVVRMLACNCGVVGAPVAMKGIDWESVCRKAFEYFQKVGRVDEVLVRNLKYAGNHYAIVHLSEPEVRGCCFTVKHIGHGLKVIQRRVFEEIVKQGVVERFDNPHDKDLLPWSWHFHVDKIIEGQRLSEDWYFDYLAGLAGFRTWCYAPARVTHFGNYGFESVGVSLPEKKND
jgi:hypothetical protein